MGDFLIYIKILCIMTELKQNVVLIMLLNYVLSTSDSTYLAYNSFPN